jgi:hypothetical protein
MRDVEVHGGAGQDRLAAGLVRDRYGGGRRAEIAGEELPQGPAGEDELLADRADPVALGPVPLVGGQGRRQVLAAPRRLLEIDPPDVERIVGAAAGIASSPTERYAARP